jgi:hypothetical protein
MGETLLEWVRKNRPSDLSVRESPRLKLERYTKYSEKTRRLLERRIRPRNV